MNKQRWPTLPDASQIFQDVVDEATNFSSNTIVPDPNFVNTQEQANSDTHLEPFPKESTQLSLTAKLEHSQPKAVSMNTLPACYAVLPLDQIQSFDATERSTRSYQEPRESEQVQNKENQLAYANPTNYFSIFCSELSNNLSYKWNPLEGFKQ
jgi:hypothetical protein